MDLPKCAMSSICKCLIHLYVRQTDDELEELKTQLLASSASKGHVKCVKFLLDCGAKTSDSYSVDIQPVLIQMLQLSEYRTRTEKHLDCALLLAQAGATVNFDNKEHINPIFDMFRKWQRFVPTEVELLKLLLRINVGNKPIEQTNSFGCTLLCCAAKVDNLELVDILLAMGADPNLMDDLKMPDVSFYPLSEAAENGNAIMIDMLLKAGAEPTGIALSKAVLCGHSACAQLLVKAGCPINVGVLFFGWERDVVADRPWEVLFTDYPNSNLPHDFVYTLLEMAVKKTYLDLIRVLLEKGVDPRFGDLTSGILFKHMETNHMVQAVVYHWFGGDWGRAVETIASGGTEKDIALLVAGGIADNKSMLIAACKIALHASYSLSVTKGLVKTLLNCGISIDVRNCYNETAFMMVGALRRTNVCQMLYLLQNGADITAIDNAGQNILMGLCMYYTGSSNLVELLCAGVVINIKDFQGRSALHFIEFYSLEVKVLIQILLIAGEKDSRFALDDEGEVGLSCEILNFSPSSLKVISRKAVRNCLSQQGSINLFVSVPRLAKPRRTQEGDFPLIPASLVPYLLYNCSLYNCRC